MLKSFLHLDHQSLIKTKSEILVTHLNDLGQTFTGKNVGTILDGEWSQTGKMGWTSGDNFVSHLPRSYQGEALKLGAVFDDSIQSWIGTSEIKKKYNYLCWGSRFVLVVSQLRLAILTLAKSKSWRSRKSGQFQKACLDDRKDSIKISLFCLDTTF